MRSAYCVSMAVLSIAIAFPLALQAADQIPTAAPMTTDIAGRSSTLAMPSVYRLQCPDTKLGGTAFLHKSGKLITAAHVVEGASASNMVIRGVQGPPIRVKSVVTDKDLDLALLTPTNTIKEPALDITSKVGFSVGMQVSTWGYPAGYRGPTPLLVSGYLSGVDVQKAPSGKPGLRWVVNAAFNSGNSGGPLVDIETGQVIGVVSSKLAPLPPDVEKALNALKNQKSGFGFTKTKSDGTTEHMSQAQVIEGVLQYLRSQTQLVIGYAVMSQDLQKFLKAQGVDP